MSDDLTRKAAMGAQMVKEVASKTSDKAGDGTTTATVLARALFAEGLKMVAAGHDPMSLKRGIDRAVKKIVDELKSLSKPTKDPKEIAQVGTISANNDSTIGSISANADESIGKTIADAMDKVGKEGVITVEDGKGLENELELVEGMRTARRSSSPRRFSCKGTSCLHPGARRLKVRSTKSRAGRRPQQSS